MVDGIYQITFRGAADWGMGILLLKDGKITGADVAGALYDGNYSDKGDNIAIKITLTVPPGVTLVMGTPPQSKEYSFDFEFSLSKKAVESRETVLLHLPPGPVNVIFNQLRKL